MINTVADEARLFFTPEGLTHSSMDPGRVVLINLALPARCFDDYHFIDEYAVTFNLKDAIKQLRSVNKKTGLTVVLEDAGLLFRLKDHGRDGAMPRAVDKRIQLLDDRDEETPTPKIFFKSRARIIAESLKETLKDMRLVSDVMSIKIDGDILHIGAHGNNFSADSEYERGADDLLEIRAEEPSTSIFTIDYLSNILNTVTKISETVEISLSTNMPIKLGAELLDGSLDFYLAPCNDGNNTPQELGAEAVHWDPKPILVYHPGDTPAPVDYKVPEPVPVDAVDVEDPGAEDIPAEVPVEDPIEIPLETVIEELPQAPAIDPWTLREARVKYYRDNPGVYETPAPEQLIPYLEGAA